MIYILMVWTTVAMAGDRHHQAKAMDWRPIGEFHHQMPNSGEVSKVSAKQMCENASKELGLKIENFRCVRAK
jgi:hypothetical protein